MTTQLATRLREGTSEAHSLAEHTTFMQHFLQGKITPKIFRQLLSNLYFVYTALETEIQQHLQHPVLGSMYFPELNRQAALEADLAFYYGDNWRSEITLSEAGHLYIQYIRDLAKSDPVRLIAHSYVRYLGDLSGGQGLKRIVRSSFSLPDHQGTSFYEFVSFSTPEAIRDFKIKYRDTLNELPINETTIESLVAEANYAFMLNRNILSALEADIVYQSPNQVGSQPIWDKAEIDKDQGQQPLMYFI
jgi:heme oxygenase